MIAHARTTGADIAAQVLASPTLKRRVPSWREFATTIVLPAGPLAGSRYKLGSDPCQDYLLRQMDSGKWERLYVNAPAQVGGKSLLCIQLPILRTTIAQRLPAGYALPTLADLDKAWAAKLLPQLKRSGYQKYLPQSGPGSRGGRGHTLTLVDPETGESCGQVIFLAGGAYGDTCATVVVDEVDQFRKADGTPLWADLEDCFQRATSYGRRGFRVATGTVESDEDSIILVLVLEHGTGTRPWQPCPQCGLHTVWSWEMVAADWRDDTSARDTARIVCPRCSHRIDEDTRQAVIRRAVFAHRGQTVADDGQVQGEDPRTNYLGLIWTGLDSALDDLGAQAVAWSQAQRLIQTHGDHSLARKFTRYKMGRGYTTEREEMNEATPLTPQSLLLRSQSCRWGPVLTTTDRGEADAGHTYSRHFAEAPEDCVAVVAGLDVQGNRVYLSAAGLKLDGTQYDIGWSYEMARPDHQPWSLLELHALLDRCDALVRRWAGALPFALGGVDTGDFTADVQSWVLGNATWVAVKGSARSLTVEGAEDIEGLLMVNADGLWHIHTQQSRALVQSALRRPNDAPGAIVIPHGLDNTASDKALLQHYCGEQMQVDAKSGKMRLIQRGRWDWLDARRYAYVLGRVALGRLSRDDTETEAEQALESRREGGWGSAVGEQW